MGRELKRVALDFDWPLNKVWKGFVNFYDETEESEEYESWQPTEPPAGEGYQLWETVSEGSPISPVFATKDLFAAYLIGEGYSAVAVERFIEKGYAPSMVMINGRIYHDIESHSAM